MSSLNIRLAQKTDIPLWESYVLNHAGSSVFHLWRWGDLADLYNHQRIYLLAEDNEKVVGVLPLIFIKSFIFGRKIISLPFCEYGCPLTKSQDPEAALIDRSLEIARNVRAQSVEFRGVPSEGTTVFAAKGFKLLGKNVTFKLDLRRGKEASWTGLSGGRGGGAGLFPPDRVEKNFFGKTPLVLVFFLGGGGGGCYFFFKK